MSVGARVRLTEIPESVTGVSVGDIGTIHRHGDNPDGEHTMLVRFGCELWWLTWGQVETLPPYCAGYRPVKTEYLPGQRVWVGKVFNRHGVVMPTRFPGTDWVCCRVECRDTDWSTHADDLRHFPFKRGPAWPPSESKHQCGDCGATEDAAALLAECISCPKLICEKCVVRDTEECAGCVSDWHVDSE